MAKTTNSSSDSAVAETSAETKPKRVLQWNGLPFEERVLEAKDFKHLNPASEVGKTSWSADNNWLVDVSNWSDLDVDSVLAADSRFKIIDAD